MNFFTSKTTSVATFSETREPTFSEYVALQTLIMPNLL